MTEGRFESRGKLIHETPVWVRDSEETFFITICCAERAVNSLAREGTGGELVASVAYRNERSRWWCSAFVVMPDHVHLLVNFPEGESMKGSLRDWKRWTARQLGISWQRDWFDHRLRAEESWRAKAEYLVNNPVRAGLVEEAEDWPYYFFVERR